MADLKPEDLAGMEKRCGCFDPAYCTHDGYLVADCPKARNATAGAERDAARNACAAYRTGLERDITVGVAQFDQGVGPCPDCERRVRIAAALLTSPADPVQAVVEGLKAGEALRQHLGETLVEIERRAVDRMARAEDPVYKRVLREGHCDEGWAEGLTEAAVLVKADLTAYDKAVGRDAPCPESPSIPDVITGDTLFLGTRFPGVSGARTQCGQRRE
jgi:hypothetical protein